MATCALIQRRFSPLDLRLALMSTKLPVRCSFLPSAMGISISCLDLDIITVSDHVITYVDSQSCILSIYLSAHMYQIHSDGRLLSFSFPLQGANRAW